MDYVLFGMGYGASLMLLGWALRTFGPQLKYSRPPREEDADFLVQRRFWVRFIQGLGGVIAIAGTTMVLMTFVVVLMNPTDDTGMIISMAIWGFILAVVLIWCGLYLSRFGLAGIWSREGGYGFRRSAAVTPRRAPLTSSPSEPTVSTEEMVVTIDDHAVPANSAVAPGLETDATTEHIQADDPAQESQNEEAGDVPVVNDPVYDFGDSTETTVPSEGGGRTEALRRLRQRQARTGQSST